METHSVTTWIAQIKAGELDAAQRLWERYLTRLAFVAKCRLAGSPQQVADVDDVIVTAFERFLRFAQEGRFPKLDDRGDLWQVLVIVTERTAIDQRRRLSAKKRGGLITRSLDLPALNADVSELQWQPQSPEPTPEFAFAAAEQCQQLLSILDDDTLRRIALAKLHGSTNEEIASHEGIGVRSVERKLNIIRRIWLPELDA